MNRSIPANEGSGLKVSDFCGNEVINEAKFYYWQKKLCASKLPIQSFVSIVLGFESPTSGLPYLANAGTTSFVVVSPKYEVVYPCGTILSVNFVKSLKGDMFYKGDFIYLYIIDFGSEFNGFGFLVSDNGAKVMPVDTHDTVGHFFACK